MTIIYFIVVIVIGLLISVAIGIEMHEDIKLREAEEDSPTCDDICKSHNGIKITEGTTYITICYCKEPNGINTYVIL